MDNNDDGERIGEEQRINEQLHERERADGKSSAMRLIRKCISDSYVSVYATRIYTYVEFCHASHTPPSMIVQTHILMSSSAS